jgi:hypothetical protein
MECITITANLKTINKDGGQNFLFFWPPAEVFHSGIVVSLTCTFGTIIKHSLQSLQEQNISKWGHFKLPDFAGLVTFPIFQK